MMARRLNIVSVCRTLPTPSDPSAGIFVLNRVSAMADLADVRVIQPVPYFPGIQPLPSWACDSQRNVDRLRVDHAPMFYFPGVLKSLDATWLARAIESRIARLHSRQRIDAIDAHFGYPEGAACVEVGRRLGIPVFVTVRGFETEYVSSPSVSGRMIDGLRAATGIVAVSHSLAKLMNSVGVPYSRMRVVHNAIDDSLFCFGEKSHARQRLGLCQNQPIIVSVGHLISRKRHHILIEAFARLIESNSSAQLYIIGAESFETAYPALLRKRAAALGITDQVSFIGNMPPATVASWLRAADVFALATAREGCCNAVIEALAVGTPVVTTRVGDNEQFVCTDRNGALVPVDDTGALATAISTALGSSRWDRQLISRELHAQTGSWSQVGRRVLQFFEEKLKATAPVE